MGLLKSQSCLHFALESHRDVEDEQIRSSSSSSTGSSSGRGYETRDTPLHLPCGSRLRLPRQSQLESVPSNLNDFLQRHPTLAQRAHDLRRTSSQVSLHDRTSQATCINVLQGELAHATAQQVDVLLSHDTTTCHILAVRSTSMGSTSMSSTTRINASSHQIASPPLTSLAHIDECNPECLENIVKEHLAHHQNLNERQRTSAKLTPLVDHTVDKNMEKEEDFGFFDAGAPEVELQEGGDFGFFDAVEDEQNFPSSSSLRVPLSSMPPLVVSTSPSDVAQFPGYAVIPSQIRNLGCTSAIMSPTPSLASPDCRIIGSMVHLELHLVGGCNDVDGTSQNLSKELLEAWAVLGEQYSDRLQLTLQTAAISALNVSDQTDGGPQARGMGIDTRTGDVFCILEKDLPSHLQAPAMEVRNARLWARAMTTSSVGHDHGHHSQIPSLSVIHTRHTRPGELTIEPFDYRPHPHLDRLLANDDTTLKRVASTSPDLESDRFCGDLRRTLSFLQTVPSSKVFGSTTNISSALEERQRPLVYARSSDNLHQWERRQDAIR